MNNDAKSNPENNYMFTDDNQNCSVEDKTHDIILDKTGFEDKSGMHSERDDEDILKKLENNEEYKESSRTINELVGDFQHNMYESNISQVEMQVVSAS